MSSCSTGFSGRLTINGIDYLIPGYQSHSISPLSSRPLNPDLSNCGNLARTWEVAINLSVLNGCNNGCRSVDGIYVRRFSGSFSQNGWTVERGTASAPCGTLNGFIYRWNGQVVFSFSPVGVFSTSIAWVRSLPSSFSGGVGGWASFSSTGGCGYSPDYTIATPNEPTCVRWPSINPPFSNGFLLIFSTAFGERIMSFSSQPQVLFRGCEPSGVLGNPNGTPSQPNAPAQPISNPSPPGNPSPLKNPNNPNEPPWDPGRPPPSDPPPLPPELQPPPEDKPFEPKPPKDDEKCCCPEAISLANNAIRRLNNV